MRDPPPFVASGHLCHQRWPLSFSAVVCAGVVRGDTDAVKRALALVVVVGLAGAVATSGPDAAEVETFLRDRGVLGPVVFVLVMWCLQPLGVPGLVFMVPAALVWPAPMAVGLSWVGNMGASFFAFAFARWIARDWAQQRLPDRLRRWDGRLARGGVAEVATLRLVTGQLTPADWLLGISSVRLGPFLTGTAIGIVPLIVIVVFAGASAGTWLFDDPVRWGSALAAIAAMLVAAQLRSASRAEPSS